jgi:hypothetical protein
MKIGKSDRNHQKILRIHIFLLRCKSFRTKIKHCLGTSFAFRNGNVQEHRFPVHTGDQLRQVSAGSLGWRVTLFSP